MIKQLLVAQVDMFALSIRSRPFTDAEELLPSCFRCQAINPLVNQAGDRCIACAHPMIRSFCNFELLPLVRFVPARDVSLQEAITLIRRDWEGRGGCEGLRGRGEGRGARGRWYGLSEGKREVR